MQVFYFTLALYMCMPGSLCISCVNFNFISTDIAGVNIILWVNFPWDLNHWNNNKHINGTVGLKPAWNEHQKYTYDIYENLVNTLCNEVMRVFYLTQTLSVYYDLYVYYVFKKASVW